MKKEDLIMVEVHHWCPYMSPKTIAANMDMSTRNVYKLLEGIREEIVSGRYDPIVISGSKVNFYAFVDYNKYKDLLKDKNMRKTVPAYDPAAVARNCAHGSYLQRVV